MTSPPPTPRSRLPVHAPSLSLGTCPGRHLAAPRPARGGRGKQNNAAREIARGHQAALRSACSPLAHYATLDRAQSAHLSTLRYAPFSSVAFCPLSRYFPEVYQKAEIDLSPTRPPLAPARSRPSLSLGTCPVRLLAAPRPARGGRGKQTNTMERKNYHGKKKNTCRAPQPGRGGPAPPSRPAFVARLALVSPLILL